jgi:hypothetical protein
MGLDTIDLIMRVEEAFGIAISDDDFSNVGKDPTVGDIYQLVLKKVETTTEGGSCITQHVFYKLRQALMEQFNIPRCEITPSTHMESLIAREGRKLKWNKLQQELGLNLPDLVRPSWLFNILSIITILCCVGIIGVGISPGLYVLACLACYAGWRFTRPLAVCFWYPTVGDSTEMLLAYNYESIINTKKALEETQVWEVLKAIFIERIRARPEEIHKNARIIKDLGMD